MIITCFCFAFEFIICISISLPIFLLCNLLSSLDDVILDGAIDLPERTFPIYMHIFLESVYQNGF